MMVGRFDLRFTSLFDALRMIVCRAETRLAAALAPGLSRPETVRTLIEAMLSGDASIVPGASAETLTVRLLHQARRRGHDFALAPLLEELNRPRTLYPGAICAWSTRSSRTISAPGKGLTATLPARPSGPNSDTPRLIDVRN